MVAWIGTDKIAEKMVELLSDNRILPSEWKYAIPLFIVNKPLPIIYNAKNMADGINQYIELNDVDIPPDKLAYDPYSKDYLLD
jgi:hypothetical protein